MDMSPVFQVWSKPSCKAQRKGEEDKADRKKEKKKRWEGNIWEWTGLEFAKPRGQRRTDKNRRNWF